MSVSPTLRAIATTTAAFALGCGSQPASTVRVPADPPEDSCVTIDRELEQARAHGTLPSSYGMMHAEYARCRGAAVRQLLRTLVPAPDASEVTRRAYYLGLRDRALDPTAADNQGCLEITHPSCAKTLWSCRGGFGDYGSGGGLQTSGWWFAEDRGRAAVAAAYAGGDEWPSDARWVPVAVEEEALCGYAYNQAEASAYATLTETPEYSAALGACQHQLSCQADCPCEDDLRNQLFAATGRNPASGGVRFALPTELLARWQSALARAEAAIECGSQTLQPCVIVYANPCDGRIATVCDQHHDPQGRSPTTPDGHDVWEYDTGGREPVLLTAIR